MHLFSIRRKTQCPMSRATMLEFSGKFSFEIRKPSRRRKFLCPVLVEIEV